MRVVTTFTSQCSVFFFHIVSILFTSDKTHNAVKNVWSRRIIQSYHLFKMLFTTVRVLFVIKLRWSEKKNFQDLIFTVCWLDWSLRVGWFEVSANEVSTTDQSTVFIIIIITMVARAIRPKQQEGMLLCSRVGIRSMSLVAIYKWDKEYCPRPLEKTL